MRKLLTFGLILLLPGISLAQDSLDYREKVYLHTDQHTYVTGEYLWFSAYVLDAAESGFSNLSKILYVEVLDKNNSAVLKTKISLENGSGDGSLFLPASLATDVYQLRAYTRWMRNGSANHYFHKWLRIFNPFIPVTTESKEDEGLQARLYPEGGAAISGETSRVVVQVTDAQGHGIPFRGMVISSDEDTIRRFTPLKFGMGNFDFPVPVSGEW